jgi:hypothetical protein
MRDQSDPNSVTLPYDVGRAAEARSAATRRGFTRNTRFTNARPVPV